MLNADRARVSAAFLFLMTLAFPVMVWAQAGTISTVAGTMLSPGFSGDGGPATSARLSSQAYGIALDAAGNVYIADTLNQRIRKVTKATGIITTIAGTGAAGFSGDGGPATSATFNTPLGVAVDSVGNVYVSDQQNDRIRKIATNGIITTFAGSAPAGANFDGDTPKSPTLAHLSHPHGLAIDSQDNLYIADTGNMRIRKVTKSTGQISTVAGTGGPSGGTGGGLGGFRGDGGHAKEVGRRIASEQRFDFAPQLFVTRACVREERVAVLSVAGERQMVELQDLLAPLGRHRGLSLQSAVPRRVRVNQAAIASRREV